MSKIIDVYNPYDNQVVTRYYVEIVKKALEACGYKVNEISTLERKRENESIFVVYPYDCYRAHNCGYTKIVLWIQGISPEESYMRNESNLRYWFLSLKERIGLKYANKIIMVSHELLEHYRRKYKINLDNKTFFMPCFNSELDEQCFYVHEKYNNQVFAYAGGLAVWQCFEQTVKLYKQIEERLSTAKFEVYTGQKDEADRIIKKYNVKNYTIDFLSPEELSNRLKKVKYGFVLREDNEVNRVATPTKISSYTADGVIPIYSSCLRDFDHAVAGKKYFVSLSNDMNDDGNLNKIIEHCNLEINAQEVHAEYSDLFETYYNKDRYVRHLSAFLS